LHIRINGEDREIAGKISLDDLVLALSLPKERIAIELNHRVVRRDHWGETIVTDGDRVEIVHFVGGGTARKQEAVSRPHEADSF